jgi:tetratricopeptide (TPR) repeat protein
LAAAALGHVLASQHQDERAVDVLEQATALHHEAATGDLTAEERVQALLIDALIPNFHGQIQLSNGDHDRAAQLFTAGLDAARSVQDRFSILISLYDLALSSQGRGDLDGAARLLRQGLSLAEETGDEPAAGYYLQALAAIALQQDDLPRAARLRAAADARLQARGSGWLHAFVPRARPDDDMEAELRSRMGDAAYEQASAHGRSRTGTLGIEKGLTGGP